MRARAKIRPSEALRDIEQLPQPFDDHLLAHTDRQTRRQRLGIPGAFNDLVSLHVQSRHVYDDDEQPYVSCRSQTRRHSFVVVWREASGDAVITHVRPLASIFKAPRCAPVGA